VVIQIFGWPCVVIGVFGNTLLIITVATQRSLRRKHFMFVFSMAVADLIVSGYVVPIWLVAVATGRYPVVNGQHCTVNSFLFCLCFYGSIYMLMLIAINRYMMVCKPVLYQRLFNENAVLCCALPWVSTGRLSILAVNKVGMRFGYTSIDNLCETGVFSVSINKIIVVLDLTVPALVVGLCSLRICLRWKATQRAVISSTNLQQNMPGHSAMPADLQASSDDQSSLCSSVMLEPSKFQRSIQPELRTEDTSFQAGPSANSKRLSRTSTTTRISKTSGTHEMLHSRHTIIE
jgi:hypothetical protein